MARRALVCQYLAFGGLQCTRLAEFVRDTLGDETVQATARVQFPGDGTVVVEPVAGEHPRVLQAGGPLEDLFDP